MNAIIVLVVVLGVVALIAITGIVRSLVRLAAAAGLGLLVPFLIYLLFSQVLPTSLNISVEIPLPVYLVLGALGALSVLLWRRH
jgi:uncharacterized protein (TIGR03382 family)